MIKLIGAAIFVLAVGYGGFRKSSAIKSELHDVKELYELAVFIRRRIEQRREPLGSIFASCYELNKNAFAKAAAEGESISDMLPDRIKSDALSFFEALGDGFSEEQINLCSDFEEKLDFTAKALSEELDKKLPLYRSLWLISALAAVIIIV